MNINLMTIKKNIDHNLKQFFSLPVFEMIQKYIEDIELCEILN